MLLLPTKVFSCRIAYQSICNERINIWSRIHVNLTSKQNDLSMRQKLDIIRETRLNN